MCVPLLVAAVLALAAGAVPAREYPVTPYVDPAQLDVEWPKHSHYKQPWRAFMDTKSGHDFVRGIGINLNVNENVDLAARLLAEASGHIQDGRSDELPMLPESGETTSFAGPQLHHPAFPLPYEAKPLAKREDTP